MRLKEFAPSGGGSGDYFQALAAAWYNGTFDTGSLQKGIKSQQDVERLLNRGIVCPDGKTRKLHIDYNSDFDGVEIYSDDYYEYGDHDDTIDSRTGQKWGPYDFMAFSDEDLSEGLNEFAADDGGSGGEGDALHKYARIWWAGNEATQMQIEAALAKMGWEIGEDEGGYDNGGVFVVRAGDENGNSYQSWAAEDLTEQGMAEGSLEEIDRRGFLKGVGAAAVAGAAGGAKAQNVNYAEAAATAVRKAQDAVGSFNSVKFGGEGSRIKNYIGQNVNRAVLAYCMDTNGYMVNEVIDYATNFAYKQADAVPPAITDRAMAVTAINVANAFMNSYDAAILQKFNEYKQSGNRAQSQQTQQPKQSSDEVDQFGNPRILKGMVELYVLAKDNNFQNVDAIKQELLQYIKITNNKDLVNDMYKGIKSGLDNVKASNPTRYNNIVSMYQESSSRRIGEFKNWTNSLSAGPEFKESVQQGVAEGSDPWGSQGRFVGDTGPTQVSTTVPKVQLRIGDRVLYKPTEQRATIEALSKDGTKARIHISSPMGGRIFNCQTADLKALGALKEKSTSQAQFRTMAAAAHDSKFARKVGIKQSVAREFNKADKGQSYKSLPKRAD